MYFINPKVNSVQKKESNIQRAGARRLEGNGKTGMHNRPVSGGGWEAKLGVRYQIYQVGGKTDC